MKPTDFRNASPRFVLEDYFSGTTHAWGIFEDRFGNLRRQFRVDITGAWDGKKLILDEQFDYDDGERDQRIWTISKLDEHTYTGTADDVIGEAKGEAYGNSLNWRYDMDLRVGGRSIRVHFNDWMYLQSPDFMLNRAQVSKLGVTIGTVTLVFYKANSEQKKAKRMTLASGQQFASAPFAATSQQPEDIRKNHGLHPSDQHVP